MSLKPFLIVILIVSGCSYIPFNKKNIETDTITDTIKESDIYSEDFTEYLIANGFNKDELPFKKWGLKELIYSQEYFNPELKTAKMQWEMVKTDEVIAKLYPQSSLGFEIGRETTKKELTKKIFGGGLNFKIESADKKCKSSAPTGNRTRVESMATTHRTTRPSAQSGTSLEEHSLLKVLTVVRETKNAHALQKRKNKCKNGAYDRQRWLKLNKR